MRTNNIAKDWQGEGWYTIEFWNCDNREFIYQSKPDAIWVENYADFDFYCDLTLVWYDYEAIVEYYGDGERPNDPTISYS